MPQSEYARCGWHGIFEDGACVCFDCWTGDACADATPLDACVVAAAGGTPLLFEDYWTRHADEATLSRHLNKKTLLLLRKRVHHTKTWPKPRRARRASAREKRQRR